MYEDRNLLDIDGSRGMARYLYDVGVEVFGPDVFHTSCIPKKSDLISKKEKHGTKSRPYLLDKRIKLLKSKIKYEITPPMAKSRKEIKFIFKLNFQFCFYM
jgi:hypothetical protein